MFFVTCVGQSVVCLLCFFFFKQKTAYEMRISDWSSDVCSSDLLAFGRDPAGGIGQSRLASGKKQGPGRQGGQGQFMPMGGIKLGLICLPRQLRCILNHHNVSPVEEYVTFVTAGV